jgi:hypothetical protein
MNKHTLIGLTLVFVMFAALLANVPAAVIAQQRTPLAAGGAGSRAQNARATAQAARENARATAQAAGDEVRATLQGGADNARATRQALATDVRSTVGAAQGNVQGTVTAAAGNIQATVTAATGNLQGTVTAAVEQYQLAVQDIQGTAQAFATNAAITGDQARATVQALMTEIPAQVQELLPAELEQMLNEALVYGSVDVDLNAGTLTMTYDLPESALNAALDTAFAAQGYDPTAAAADFIPEGVFITLESAALDAEFDGRVTALAEIAVVNGRVTVSVVYATLNDRPLPQQYVDELNAVIQQAFNEARALWLDAYAVNYTVTTAFTTDTSLIIGAVMALQ